MTDSSSRIEQFRKMAEADPANELGHFSLARALLDAGRTEEAVASFDRVLQLNANLSKVYELQAAALLKLGRGPQATETLTRGVLIADQRGDILPRDAMLKMLKDLGAPAPQLKSTASAAAAVGEGQVLCRRCGRAGARLPSPPFSNAQGRLIYDSICAPCWREWIGMGTKVINELRLPLADPQAGKIWEQHMVEFLNLK